MSHADPTAVAVMQVHAPPPSHNLASANPTEVGMSGVVCRAVAVMQVHAPICS
jgi:hypothetical protein